MINPLGAPLRSSENVSNIDKNFDSITLKINEISDALNKPSKGHFMKDEVLRKLEEWKKDANDFRDNPDAFPGVSREVCVAVSYSLFKCYIEMMEIIGEV